MHLDLWITGQVINMPNGINVDGFVREEFEAVVHKCLQAVADYSDVHDCHFFLNLVVRGDQLELAHVPFMWVGVDQIRCVLLERMAEIALLECMRPLYSRLKVVGEHVCVSSVCSLTFKWSNALVQLNLLGPVFLFIFLRLISWSAWASVSRFWFSSFFLVLCRNLALYLFHDWKFAFVDKE